MKSFRRTLPSLKLFAIFLLSSRVITSKDNIPHDKSTSQLASADFKNHILLHPEVGYQNSNQRNALGHSKAPERQLRVRSPTVPKRDKLKRALKSIFKDFSRNFRKLTTEQVEGGDSGRGLREKPAFFNVSATPQINTSKISVLNFAAPAATEANGIRERDRAAQPQVLSSKVSTRYGLLKLKRV